MKYSKLLDQIKALIKGETDEIALYSTVCCELYHNISDLNWAGFYRNVNGLLKVGPYQGTHGCLEVTFDRGVVGKCARERAIQVVDDISKLKYHIACSSDTKSEVCLPLLDEHGSTKAVLDLDSTVFGKFDEELVKFLKDLINLLGNSC